MPASRLHRVVCIASGVLACALVRADDPIEFDFFDYLGEMIEVDGAWVDPVSMDEPNVVAIDPQSAETTEMTNDELMDLGPGDSDSGQTDIQTGDL